MKRKAMLRNSHTLLSLTLVTVSLMTVGYSSWVITSGSDGVSYDSKDGNVSSELTNSGKEVTMNFETTADPSSLAEDVSTSNSYDNCKLEAKLDYTENDDYPLADNFEISDPLNPYGGGSPTLTETNSGTEFNLENHYISSEDKTVSSWINYQACYDNVDSSAPSDDEIKNKLGQIPYYTAPPEGYTSDYKIYSTSDTGQTSTNYKFVATRLQSTSDTTKYKKYRVYIFYYALQDGKQYLTYYTNGSSYQSSDTTKGWPTISVSSNTMYTNTTSRSEVKFTDSSSDATLGTSALTYYFNDTNWSTNAGQDPYIEMMDTSKTPSDFDGAVDAICRDWIQDFMKSLNSSSTYTCDPSTDIISDTDTYGDLDASADNADDLILGMDTSRYPWTKTYFARMTYKSSSTADPQYRYYRVFHFVYIRSTGKLKVMHCNANIGVGTGTNYSDTYPQIYITSVDESSNASVYNRYQSGSTSSSYFRITFTYYTKSSASASDTTSSTSSYYAKLVDKDTYIYKLDTSATQDDFDDDVIYSYMKGSAQPDSTAATTSSDYYTTEVICDYDEVAKYVTGMENYPYVKFVMTRRHYPNQTSYSYQYYYLYGIVKRYSSANGQLSYGYTNVNLSTSCRSDQWPTYTLYGEGQGYSGASEVSATNNQDYIKNKSVISLTRYYYANSTSTSLSTSNTTLTLAGNDTYAYADTLPYDSDLESELSTSYSMSEADYRALVNTEEEEKAETDNFNRHFSNTYSLYYGVDESKDNNFSWYIDSSGNYYFTWLYYRNAWYGSSSASPTAATTQGKFYTYQNPLYGGYQYNSGQTALTTSNLDPSEWEYQGYELDQPMQTLNPLVRYVFKSNSTDEVRKYVFTLGGTQAKTYFGTTMDSTAGMISKYDLTYRVTFRARTDYASTHMEELLKGYNFKFSIGINNEEVYGDYL